jgi:hypothetical protein
MAAQFGARVPKSDQEKAEWRLKLRRKPAAWTSFPHRIGVSGDDDDAGLLVGNTGNGKSFGS